MKLIKAGTYLATIKRATLRFSTLSGREYLCLTLRTNRGMLYGSVLPEMAAYTIPRIKFGMNGVGIEKLLGRKIQIQVSQESFNGSIYNRVRVVKS